MAESHTKRRRWSDLHDDILITILKRLFSVDVKRCASVCTSWSKVVHSWKSSSSFTPKYAAPWLMLPPVEQEEKYSFVSFEEKKLLKRKNMCKDYGKSLCIGSSHGWLVLLDEWAVLYLMNPWTRERIQFPSLNTFEDVVKINRSRKDTYVRDSQDLSKLHCMSLQQFRESFIYKAILSADPSHSKDFGVIVIYNSRSKIAFSKNGVDWKDHHGAYGYYHDIICKNNQVFASSDELYVEVWNFSNYYPVKVMEIEICGLRDLLPYYVGLTVMPFMRWYLVESLGDVLLVLRIYRRLQNKFNKYDLLSNLLSNPDLSLPYKTLRFNVFKLEPNLNGWVQMDSLGDRVLFLGGNHSTSLSTQDFPTLEMNSIYFTDDYWQGINDAQLSDGVYDVGIFNLEKKSVKPVFKCGIRRIPPPPFWIAPNPWEKKI